MKTLQIKSSDATKWGPSDFYDDVREAIAAAYRTGEDFDTGWMSCKKEALSSCITRSGETVEVSVSVSDDLDTEGVGTVEEQVADTEEKFFEQLERMGAGAHRLAEEERVGNASYIGYSVGRGTQWEYTYLIDQLGLDYPPGDNYHWWGWQEVDEEGQCPEEIPADVAEFLERGMHAGESKITCGDWTARQWE